MGNGSVNKTNYQLMIQQFSAPVEINEILEIGGVLEPSTNG